MPHNFRLVKGARQQAEENPAVKLCEHDFLVDACPHCAQAKHRDSDGIEKGFRALDVRVIADYACSRGRHMFIAPGTKADVKCPMCGEAARLVAGTERMDKSKRV